MKPELNTVCTVHLEHCVIYKNMNLKTNSFHNFISIIIFVITILPSRITIEYLIHPMTRTPIVTKKLSTCNCNT